MALTDIKSYPVAHNKNGGSGGTTYIMGGQKSGVYNSINVHSINASQGNIDYLKTKSISANEGQFLYLQAKEGQILRLSGEALQYDTGYIGMLSSDYINTKKLKAEDLDVVNAWIETLNSKEITTEYLTVTKQAHFFELVIDKIRSVGGQLILTPASCIVDYVMAYDISGNRINTVTANNIDRVAYFDVYWRATEDTGRSVSNDFMALDQVICQSFNNAHEGVNYNISNKYYWRLVNEILSDTYVNLSTGALSNSASVSSKNSFELQMMNTYSTQINNDVATNIDNGIQWNAAAQTIEGIYTNVSWTNGTAVQGACINGTFESSSKLYGLQITPVLQQNIPQPITSELKFNMKQVVGDGVYAVPHNINIGIYFEDDTYMTFNDVHFDSEYNCTINLDNPNAPIEAIVIVSTNDVDWHLCHCMRISNTDCDNMLSGYSSIPSAGDNLVQLGYRGTDEENADRQSAIIISAYKSPDPDVHAPSYAQYRGINDYNLGSHRGSYIDARGAKFVGDITLCTVDGKTIGETLQEQAEELEKSNKKLVIDTSIIQQYPYTDGTAGVYSQDPTHIDIGILALNADGTSTVLSTVPHGYIVEMLYFNTQRQIDGQYTQRFVENDSLSHIQLATGSDIGVLSMLRIRLLKEEAGMSLAQYPIVDYKDISYIKASQEAQDGGRWEFSYCNYTPVTGALVPTKPTTGSNGIGTFGGCTWTRSASTPDFANGQYTFMSQCYCTAAGAYGEWTNPFRITGDNGKDGEDGTDIEYIYTTNNTGIAPAAPPQTQVDDWHGYDANTGYTWTDNPVGVAANRQYEYVSQRVKRNGGLWGLYSTPVIWAKWGEKGMDGDGYEYIFKLTATNVAPVTPIDSPQQDDYVPTGWTDDPESVSQSFPYQWCSVRKKENGTWGAFSTPSLWARYAEQGETGGHYEFRYKNHTPTTQNPLPATPTGDGTTGGWSATPTNPDVNNGEYTYMSQSFVTPGQNGGNDTYGTWTTPIRITGGQGEDGADGTDIEFVYTRNNTGIAPAAPETNQTDDWHGTSGGVTWTDNPQGVQSDLMYEYVSMRYKRDDVWTAYSTPVVWSKWGEKGMDGDGYEYIYKVTATADVPSNPTPNDWQTNVTYQAAEYVPTGWTDDPESVTESTPYQWVCVRERHNGVWGQFSTPALWSRWATQGSSGGHYEFRYKNSLTKPNAPTGTGESNGWSRTPTNPTESEKYTWMSQTYVNGNDEYGTWTDPIRITGPQGEHGADGNDIEFIYTRNNTGVAPSTPTTSQTDDYVPSGWTDNPQGVSSTMMYEYVSTRTKESGTWSAFSTPVVWSKWGEKGMDGDGYEYIYKATANSTAPSRPTDSPNTDDHVPSGWSDEPVSLSSSNPYLWVCVRKKTNGTWGTWSTPALWSHYASAEGGTPGADGQNAQFDYLIPNKEILQANIINAISNNTNVDLQCDLDYTLVHVDGNTTSTLDWSTSSYVIHLKAFNKELNQIWQTYMTNNGYASGTPQGTYSQTNLLSIINSSGAAAKRDYMKCYKDYPSNCPIYLTVELKSGTKVLDKRVVNVQLENGAVLKVTDDAINSAVAQSNTNMNTALNNYSTTSQTAELINTTVSAQMSNYVTSADMTSAINQSAQSITSTVEANYYTKSDIDTMLNDDNSIKQVVNLLTSEGFNENTYYPVSINMAPTGVNGIPVSNGLICTLQVDRSLNESGFGTPSWGSVYNGSPRGCALLCNWSIIPSGWGQWSNGELYVNQYILRYTRNSYSDNDAENTGGTKVIGNLQQHNPSNTMVFYLRGGSKYNVRFNWTGLEAVVHKNTWSTGTTEPKSYSPISGADSAQIIVPTKDKMNKSEIEQTARRISLSVYSEQDSGDNVTAEQLKRTGIDIYSGNIDLNADNTNVLGTLNIYNENAGFQVWDSTRTRSVQIRNDRLGYLKDYNHGGMKTYVLSKSGTKPATSTGGYFTITFDKVTMGTFTAGTKCDLSPIIFNIYDDNFYLISAGSDKTITKLEWTVNIVGSSNTVRATKTVTMNTPDSFTRSWMGHIFTGTVEYTPESNETLSVSSTIKCYTKDTANYSCKYNAVINVTSYVELNSSQKMQIDGMILSSDGNGTKEYTWWGPYKIGNRTQDYAFEVRNRRHNMRITTFGVQRTMFGLFNEGDQWINNGQSGDISRTTQSSGSERGENVWCDVGSYTPVLSLSSNTDLDTLTEQGVPEILQCGIIVNTSSSNITVNLPDPSKLPGKQIWFKGINGGIKFTCTFNNNNHFVFDDNTEKMKEFGPTSTTGMLFSAGGYWVHFNSN